MKKYNIVLGFVLLGFVSILLGGCASGSNGEVDRFIEGPPKYASPSDYVNGEKSKGDDYTGAEVVDWYVTTQIIKDVQNGTTTTGPLKTTSILRTQGYCVKGFVHNSSRYHTLKVVIKHLASGASETYDLQEESMREITLPVGEYEITYSREDYCWDPIRYTVSATKYVGYDIPKNTKLKRLKEGSLTELNDMYVTKKQEDGEYRFGFASPKD